MTMKDAASLRRMASVMLDGKEKIMTIDSIKRYTVSGDIAYPVHEDPEGDYVTYEDHVAAIEADRKRRGEPVAYIRTISFENGEVQRDLVLASAAGDLSRYMDFFSF